MIKDFINLGDFSGQQLQGLLDRAIADKALFSDGRLPARLARKTLVMIFEKPSLRTRVSFEVAMTQLGGSALNLTQAEIGLGQREAVQDVARVLGRMCDAVMARTFRHELIEQLAEHCPVPVINGLSDRRHPAQAMADLMTVTEHFGELGGKTLVFIGDGNNVARSLATACAKLDVKFILACPKGYELERSLAAAPDPADDPCTVVHDPKAAVTDADVIYTDTWVSMGQEEEKQKRLKIFAPFQVNADLLAAAPDHAIVMHCLPAYRGCEITDDTFEAYAGTIFAQAENRLHFQRTLLNVLIAEGGIG